MHLALLVAQARQARGPEPEPEVEEVGVWTTSISILSNQISSSHLVVHRQR